MGDLGTRALAETGYDPAAYGVDVEEIKNVFFNKQPQNKLLLK
jgi:hypothetical protein